MIPTDPPPLRDKNRPSLCGRNRQMDVYGAQWQPALTDGVPPGPHKTWIQIGLGNAAGGWMSSLATRARSQLPDCFHPTLVTMVCGRPNQVAWNRLLTSIAYLRVHFDFPRPQKMARPSATAHTAVLVLVATLSHLPAITTATGCAGNASIARELTTGIWLW